LKGIVKSPSKRWLFLWDEEEQKLSRAHQLETPTQWSFEKTGVSRVPQTTNLIKIVVDANNVDDATARAITILFLWKKGNDR